MTEEIKPKRRYISRRRQVQAAETRRHIVEAARQLFAERGYVGTTIEAIAQAADVAGETVYATFGSKRAILARLVEVSVGGDEQPIPLLERPSPQAVRQEHDQHRQIQRFAHDMREIMERMSPLFEIMRTAAKTDPDIMALLQRLLEERLRGMRQFVDWLAANGSLRQSIRPADTAETVWALTSAEIHRLLTDDRGWSGERYEEWLSDTLTTLLLP
jgi:AcrR family transcriptional regulator